MANTSKKHMAPKNDAVATGDLKREHLDDSPNESSLSGITASDRVREVLVKNKKACLEKSNVNNHAADAGGGSSDPTIDKNVKPVASNKYELPVHVACLYWDTLALVVSCIFSFQFSCYTMRAIILIVTVTYGGQVLETLRRSLLKPPEPFSLSDQYVSAVLDQLAKITARMLMWWTAWPMWLVFRKNRNQWRNRTLENWNKMMLRNQHGITALFEWNGSKNTARKTLVPLQGPGPCGTRVPRKRLSSAKFRWPSCDVGNSFPKDPS